MIDWKKIKIFQNLEDNYENFLCRYGVRLLLLILALALLGNAVIFYWLALRPRTFSPAADSVRIKTELYPTISNQLEKNKSILEEALKKDYRDIFR